jgi:hypothetical protein
MIRAHMATFPARHDIMLQVVKSISVQVDHLYICLNEYNQVPVELSQFENVTAIIPQTDLKDLGKFCFNVAPDDIVFTIDDDIVFPETYVVDTMAAIKHVGLQGNLFGYMANAWVFKKQKDIFGWRNYLFGKGCKDMFFADILGTGTAVMMGCDVPPLNALTGATGFVDIRFAQWQKLRGNRMWSIPRGDGYLRDNLPAELKKSSLFETVAISGGAQLESETRKLIAMTTEYSGKPWRNIKDKLQPFANTGSSQ